MTSGWFEPSLLKLSGSSQSFIKPLPEDNFSFCILSSGSGQISSSIESATNSGKDSVGECGSPPGGRSCDADKIGFWDGSSTCTVFVCFFKIHGTRNSGYWTGDDARCVPFVDDVQNLHVQSDMHLTLMWRTGGRGVRLPGMRYKWRPDLTREKRYGRGSWPSFTVRSCHAQTILCARLGPTKTIPSLLQRHPNYFSWFLKTFEESPQNLKPIAPGRGNHGPVEVAHFRIMRSEGAYVLRFSFLKDLNKKTSSGLSGSLRYCRARMSSMYQHS